MATAEARTTRFDPSALKQLLDGRYEVRFIAGDLVDAFGIPDAVLAAPIGLREGQSA